MCRALCQGCKDTALPLPRKPLSGREQEAEDGDMCATAKPEVSTGQRVQERLLKQAISDLTLEGQAGVSQVEKGATGRRNNTRKDPMANLCLDTEVNATLHKP